jgi:serine/threonine protein kinase
MGSSSKQVQQENESNYGLTTSQPSSDQDELVPKSRHNTERSRTRKRSLSSSNSITSRSDHGKQRTLSESSRGDDLHRRSRVIEVVPKDDPSPSDPNSSGKSKKLVIKPDPKAEAKSISDISEENAAHGSENGVETTNGDLNSRPGAQLAASRMNLPKFFEKKCCFRWPPENDGGPSSNRLVLKPGQSNPLTWVANVGNSKKAIVSAYLVKTQYGFEDKIAIKDIRIPITDKEDATQKVEHEIEALKHLRHNHIIAFLGSIVDNQFPQISILMFPVASFNLCHFMEIASNHNQKRQIGDAEHEHIPMLRNFFACLCRALLYLHEKAKIKHKDIKPENILVDRFGSVIITDFGISTIHPCSDNPDTVGPTPFTIKYGAPEAIEGTIRGFDIDIFSLGCVFLEMATVILGETFKKLYETIGQSPDQDEKAPVKYHDCLHVDKWVQHLQDMRKDGSSRTLIQAPAVNLADDAEDQILTTIMKMMSKERKGRPSLKEVWDLFDRSTTPCRDCHPKVFFLLAEFIPDSNATSGPKTVGNLVAIILFPYSKTQVLSQRSHYQVRMHLFR